MTMSGHTATRNPLWLTHSANYEPSTCHHSCILAYVVNHGRKYEILRPQRLETCRLRDLGVHSRWNRNGELSLPNFGMQHHANMSSRQAKQLEALPATETEARGLQTD